MLSDGGLVDIDPTASVGIIRYRDGNKKFIDLGESDCDPE